MTTLPSSITLKSASQWDNKWHELFDHYQNDPRHAFYINAYLSRQDKVIELAAGSFRDTFKLNELGINCHAMDFSHEAVRRAQALHPELNKQLNSGNAFDLEQIHDKEFDVSFHNGFWVLFDDHDIEQLAMEQARISKRLMIATVHNAHNAAFIDYFAQQAEQDELFRIRFFTKDEIEAQLSKHCKSVFTIPVGKGKKYFEDLLIREGMADAGIMRAYFDSAGLSKIENSERLMCIGVL